jgi:hypothetical protein
MSLRTLRVLSVGVGLVGGAALVVLKDDDQSSTASLTSYEVRKTCRATAHDYDGQSLAERLIACHRALGRPFPACRPTPRNPAAGGGLVLPGHGPSTSLVYASGDAPCVASA